MKAFLEEVAIDIIQKHKKLNRVCIVFPNKRSGHFFRKYFGQAVGKTSWSPNIYTIESLIKKFSGFLVPDKLTLLFSLFETFSQVFDNERYYNHKLTYSFDKFYSTGELLLSDFNELDNYLIDVNQIFANIKDLAEIDAQYNFLDEEHIEAIKLFWQNFSDKNQSIEKQRYLELWKKIPEIYHIFSNHLINSKRAYTGLINRYVVEKIESKELRTNYFEKYVFVGFNALNKAEKKIFSYLLKEDKATFYWDIDEYYIIDKKQEAGFFLRENIKIFPNELNKKYPKNIKEKTKDIEIIGVPLEIGQAKSIQVILEKYIKENKDNLKLDRIAIIFTDEHLLFPVLHSLPPQIENINITMGYPFKDTPLYSLIDNYLKLIKQIQNTDEAIKYYHKDVFSILQHPEIWSLNKDLSEMVIAHIKESNKIYIPEDYLLAYKHPLFNLFFKEIDLSDNGINVLTNLLDILSYLFTEKNKDDIKENLDNEYIYQVYVQVKRFRELIVQYAGKISLSIDITIKFLRQLLDSIRIPFGSEMIDGIQLIGIMETRNLDFDKIILLNMNEGIFPSTSKKASLISENMRFAFDLPVIKYQDSIFAYFFYRLLQRSKNISILYNNITNYNSSGELSRFVNQIIFESDLKIVHKQFRNDLKPVVNQPILVEKNEQIMAMLQQFIAQGNFAKKTFSASAINKYLNCSLQFYFKYIAKIEEPTEIEEEMTPISIGNILHFSIESIYKEVLDKKKANVIEKADFKNIYPLIEKYVILGFKHEFDIPTKHEFEFTGTNIIIKDVINEYIKNILKYDESITPFHIIDLEQRKGYSTKIQFNHNGNTKNVIFYGVFDRIDIKDGVYRIVDYKTGNVKNTFSSIEALFDSENSSRNGIILQALLYALIFKNLPEYKNVNINTAIYGVRNIVQTSFTPYLKYNRKILMPNTLLELLPAFKDQLSNLISEIFNKEIPFNQTKNQDNCLYCPYKEICSK